MFTFAFEQQRLQLWPDIDQDDPLLIDLEQKWLSKAASQDYSVQNR